MLQLAAEGKIMCYGCFTRRDGNPLWGCTDCGRDIDEDQYVFRNTDTPVMREALACIESAFNTYQELPNEELKRLFGRELFRSFFRSSFQSGATSGCLELIGDVFRKGRNV